MFKFKKLTSMLIIMSAVFLLGSFAAYASSRTTVYNKGDWKVYLDSPDNTKTYYHLHFYEKSKHIYCLRLDNFQYCDGKNNKDKVPRKVMETTMENTKVQNAVKFHNPGVEKSTVFYYIVKWGAVTLSAILIVIAFFNVFTGPADDVVAWAAFLKALAY